MNTILTLLLVFKDKGLNCFSYLKSYLRRDISIISQMGAWQVVRNEFDRYVKRQKENEREKFERSVNCSKIKRKNELMIKIFL